MFENPRRGRQARNSTTNAPKTLDLKSSSEQIFFRKLPLGAPDQSDNLIVLHAYTRVGKQDEKNMIPAFGENCSQTEISTDFSTN